MLTRLAALLALSTAACMDDSARESQDSRDVGAEGLHTTPCGALTCAAGEFCEVVNSDVPEFPTGYARYQCRQLPGCDTEDFCECIEATQRCQLGSSALLGTCAESPDGGLTLTCNVGG